MKKVAETSERDLSVFAQHLLIVRQWEKRNIPKSLPQIGLDVALYAVASAQGASVKDFHVSLGYSQDRVRDIINLFLREGLLEVRVPDGDRRTKIIVPTAKLVGLLVDYRSVYFEGLPLEKTALRKKSAFSKMFNFSE